MGKIYLQQWLWSSQMITFCLLYDFIQSKHAGTIHFSSFGNSFFVMSLSIKWKINNPNYKFTICSCSVNLVLFLALFFCLFFNLLFVKRKKSLTGKTEIYSSVTFLYELMNNAVCKSERFRIVGKCVYILDKQYEQFPFLFSLGFNLTAFWKFLHI